MKKLLLVSLLFSLSANATDIDKDAAKARDVIGTPGSAISDPTLGGTTTYSGTSVTTANYHYGDAYMAARNQQMQGVATPSITGTSYRNHVNQLMSQSLAAVAPVAPPTQNTPSTVLATTIQQAKPATPNIPTTATNTTAPTINVDSSTLKPDAQIMTDKGIVTASTLKPGTQVAVPYDSAFTTSVRGGHNHTKGFDHAEHGTGNGANNAANSNSAHGLGGGSHIGGGRSGGGFHY